MIAKAQAKLGRTGAALHHAERCLAATTAAGLADFDLAYAHEVRARALTLAGRDTRGGRGLGRGQGRADR